VLILRSIFDDHRVIILCTQTYPSSPLPPTNPFNLIQINLIPNLPSRIPSPPPPTSPIQRAREFRDIIPVDLRVHESRIYAAGEARRSGQVRPRHAARHALERVSAVVVARRVLAAPAHFGDLQFLRGELLGDEEVV
jgi:hypothetical protein